MEKSYHELLGGRFIGHGPVVPVRVTPTHRPDPVFGALPPFTVQDELYRHEIVADVTVHFQAGVDGAQEPVAWTRRFGRGRVLYCALGHRSGMWAHPAVRGIIARGVAWLVGQEPEQAER